MRVAFIGVSHWHASMHIESFCRAGAELVAVSDADANVASQCASERSTNAFTDYRAMIEESNPDFVMAMGRHVELPQVARDLLEWEIPFGIEKPLGVSADEIADLLQIAQGKNLFVAVPFINRYSVLWSLVDELSESGRLGVKTHAHFRVINGPPTRYRDMGVPWMLDPAISGGGAMRNLGIHTVDAFSRLVEGDKTKIVGAALTYRAHAQEIEDMGCAVLRSAKGVIGTVEAGYTYASTQPGGDFELRLATGNCYLIDKGDRVDIATLDDNRVEQVPNMTQQERYREFGPDTLGRLAAGRPPIAGLKECYVAMLLLDEIYRTAVRTE